MKNSGAVVAGHTITCVIVCKTAEMLREAEELARDRFNLSETISITYAYAPGGVETRFVKDFKLGDYFESIDVERDESDAACSFKIIFHSRQGVTSYWKDLMMAVLRSVREATGASIRSISKPA